MTDTWKAANTDIDFINDPQAMDKVARRLFTSGLNGAFIINSHDQIQDRHSGMSTGGDTSWVNAFTPAAWYDDDGFGYVLPQTYLCCDDIIGTYTITRAAGAGEDGTAAVLVKKSGP